MRYLQSWESYCTQELHLADSIYCLSSDKSSQYRVGLLCSSNDQVLALGVAHKAYALAVHNDANKLLVLAHTEYTYIFDSFGLQFNQSRSNTMLINGFHVVQLLHKAKHFAVAAVEGDIITNRPQHITVEISISRKIKRYPLATIQPPPLGFSFRDHLRVSRFNVMFHL